MALCQGLPGWAGTSHHPDHHPIFISFFRLPRSIACSQLSFGLRACNLFAQPLSMSSLVYLLVWSPHIPYISSPNQCLLFAAHAHTIAEYNRNKHAQFKHGLLGKTSINPLVQFFSFKFYCWYMYSSFCGWLFGCLLVGRSLTSVFSTNTAISETKFLLWMFALFKSNWKFTGAWNPFAVYHCPPT